MRDFNRAFHFVLLSQLLVSSAIAVDIPFCNAPWATFSDTSYRPLLEFEPKRRAEGESAAAKPYALPLELALEQADKPIRAGRYTVGHVPVFDLKAASPETGVYFYDKDFQKMSGPPG